MQHLQYAHLRPVHTARDIGRHEKNIASVSTGNWESIDRKVYNKMASFQFPGCYYLHCSQYYRNL